MNLTNDDPPQLSVIIPKLRDLPEVSKDWDTDVELPTEVLLVTVKDWEFLGCFLYLKNQFNSYHRDLGRVYFGEMGEDKVRVSLLKCSQGSAGPGAALSKVKSAITFLRPKVVFCVGYCGGLSKEKTKLGDVVISSRLTTYDHKKVMYRREEALGAAATPVSPYIADLIKFAAYGWKAPLDEPRTRNVEVHQDGEILSGPELVKSVTRRDELLRKHPRALAIEMEGQGVFAAAHDLKMEWVVVKGISDYADGTKSSTEAWQPFASVMAASVVANILKGPGILRDWEHYKGVTQKGNKVHQQASGPRSTVLSDYEPVITLIQSITGGSSDQVNFKGRTIPYTVQGRVHSPRELWVYDGEAWDIESGIYVKKRHYKRSKDAMQAAVKDVIKQLKSQGLIQD